MTTLQRILLKPTAPPNTGMKTADKTASSTRNPAKVKRPKFQGFADKREVGTSLLKSVAWVLNFGANFGALTATKSSTLKDNAV